jgi:hypothetical protein
MPGGGATPRGAPAVAAAQDERHTPEPLPDDKEPETLWHSKTLAAILAFGGCNSIMLIINKMAIRLLPVPSLVLVAQLLASALFCQAGAAVGVLDNDAFEWGKIRAFFPAVCGFLAALFCNAKARGKHRVAPRGRGLLALTRHARHRCSSMPTWRPSSSCAPRHRSWSPCQTGTLWAVSCLTPAPAPCS